MIFSCFLNLERTGKIHKVGFVIDVTPNQWMENKKHPRG